MDRIDKTTKFVKSSLKGLDPAHGIKHVEITASFAEQIARKENVNPELCIIAALLHDIGLHNISGRGWKKETVKDNHGIDSAKKVKPFLLSLNFSKLEIKHICEAISQHCFPKIQRTKIAKILWDADKLNIFSKEMEHTYIKHFVSRGMTEKKAKERIIAEREYYSPLFNTKTAIRLAKSLSKELNF